MTASITTDLRKTLGILIGEGIDSDRYYIGIGKSMPYQPGFGDTPPVQVDSDISSLRYEREARNSLQSIKRVTGSSFVTPRVTWTSGVTYYNYDDNVSNQETDHIVINSNNEVFVCLETGKLVDGTTVVSTVEPTSAKANYSAGSFRDSDNYLWRYLYPISPNDMNRFGTASYIPVKEAGNVILPQDSDQLELQTQASPGEILSAVVTAGGQNYTSAPTIKVIGDVPLGDSAQFKAIINGGVVTSIRVDSDNAGNSYHGTGYKNATLSFSGGGGSGAAARVIMGPKNGLNSNPIEAVRARDYMITTNFDNDEQSSILSENDFRQVLLIKNPTIYGSNSPFTGNTGNAMVRLDFSGVSDADFREDDTITSQTNTSAKIVYYDVSNTQLYIHQDDETGYGPWASGVSVEATVGTGLATLANPPTVDPDIDAYSGDCLFIHNNTAVSRASTQTEDVKLIIKF